METLTGFVLLVIRVVTAGWIWTPHRAQFDELSGFDAFLLHCGRVVVAGLLINILTVTALASIGWWRPELDWCFWTVVLAAGALKRWRNWDTTILALKWFWGTSVVIASLGAVALLLPLRSEWLAGGWDPGIYQNNAVVIANHNGLAARHDTVYAQMRPEERALYTRSDERYHEILPGVPVDIRDGSLSLYFFHLSPLVGALLYRMGGLGLMLRMPVLLAFWGLLPLLGLAVACGLRGWRSLLVLAAALVSPLWWYHQAIPTSEMLYIILLLGSILFYVTAVRDESRFPVFMSISLFAATINHFNFPVLAAILLAVAATCESASAQPGRFARLICAYVAILLGIMWDLHFARITIIRLDEKDAVLSVVLPFFAVGAAVGLVTGLTNAERWREKAQRMLGMLLRAASVVICALMVVIAADPLRKIAFRLVDPAVRVEDLLERVHRLAQFNGFAWIALGAVGLFGLASVRRGSRVILVVVVVTLGAGLLALILNPGIAPLYPWALRRYVAVWFPFFALLQAFAVVNLIESWSHRRVFSRVAVTLLMAFGLWQGLSISWDALRVGDYKGVRSVLAELDQVIGARDIVVADDPRWGTPLALMYGRDVFNGRKLWRSKDAKYQSSFLAGLDRMQKEEGRRVVWLTSTRDGMGIYPPIPGDMACVAVFSNVQYRTVVHSARAGSFAAETHDKIFNLNAWSGLP